MTAFVSFIFISSLIKMGVQTITFGNAYSLLLGIKWVLFIVQVAVPGTLKKSSFQLRQIFSVSSSLAMGAKIRASLFPSTSGSLDSGMFQLFGFLLMMKM